MKKLLMVMVILGVGLPAGVLAAPLLLQEEFSYAPTTLLTATGNWAAHSGAGSNAIVTTASGLVYAGYPSSGIGNAASMPGNGEDDHSPASTVWTVNSGTIYAAFMVNFSSATAAGDYFAHFYGSTTSFYGRVWAKLVSGSVNLGITHGSGAANFSATPFALNTTHLIVVKYTFNAGTLNDTADLWVDPAPACPNEPTPLISSNDTAAADASQIIGYALRQGSAGPPIQWVDGIRVGTTWQDVVCGTPVGACCTPLGACTLTEQTICLSPNVWHPELTSCEPNPCPQPQGACCAPDGSCTMTAQAACVSPSIWHSEFTSCSPNPCPQPQGACCHPDGSCDFVLQAQCADTWMGFGSLCDPNPCPPPFGACCDPGGNCTFVQQANCADTWLGFGSTCDVNPCQAPIGACCAPDGGCTLTTEVACATPSVWHPEFTICLPNPCPQPSGACCHPNGTCDFVTLAQCADTWMGFGSVCDPNPCPQPQGACCHENGTCDFVLQTQCADLWLGFGSVCDPNPCAQPGACCFTNGDCMVLSSAQCALQGGTFIGGGIACLPYPCPPMQVSFCQIAEDDANGAPVLLNKKVEVEGIATVNTLTFGTGQDFAITDGNCCTYVFGGPAVPLVAIGDRVHVIGTVTQFNGKTEIGNPGLVVTIISNGNPVPPPTLITTMELATNGEQYESCLIQLHCVHIVSGTWPAAGANATLVIQDASGVSANLFIDRDTNIDGTPQPAGEFSIIGVSSQFDSSSPYSDGFEIDPRSTADLLDDCTPPSGACCHADGLCQFVTEAQCAGVGIWHPEWTECFPNPCPQPLGACCCPGETVCTMRTQDNCLTPCYWLGPGTVCEPNPCPGACCDPLGDCSLVAQAQCLAPNVWNGAFSCDPNPCPQPPLGACCSPSGACALTTEINCADIWHPEWTVCDPNPCPQPMGACCTPAGACTLTDAAHCLAPNVWHAEWVVCDPNPCPQPPQGACCNPTTGECALTTQAACLSPNAWHAEWTSCDPNPCPVVPTEKTSWGQIKNKYR